MNIGFIEKYQLDTISIHIILHTIFIQASYYLIDNYSYDWVEIYDGGNSSSTLIGRKMCGHKLPPPILSSTNEILIKFKSDNTVERTGYKIRAEAVGKT